MLRRHVTIEERLLLFDFPAKSGTAARAGGRRRGLARRRGGAEASAAAARSCSPIVTARRWRELHAEEVNDYVKRSAGVEFTAKDFRTWNATVLAAVALAARADDPAGPPRAGRQRGDQDGRGLSRQHARGLPRLLRRPARRRPLQGRYDDRCGTRAAPAETGPTSHVRACAGGSSPPSWSCCS